MSSKLGLGLGLGLAVYDQARHVLQSSVQSDITPKILGNTMEVESIRE